jgi:hypothetical protein
MWRQTDVTHEDEYEKILASFKDHKKTSGLSGSDASIHRTLYEPINLWQLLLHSRHFPSTNTNTMLFSHSIITIAQQQKKVPGLRQLKEKKEKNID